MGNAISIAQSKLHQNRGDYRCLARLTSVRTKYYLCRTSPVPNLVYPKPSIYLISLTDHFFSKSDLIYTEQQTSRKSMVQQLTCACRRQQCNWSRPGNTAVKKIFCAQPFECTNPTDFFPNDYNGKYLIWTLMFK